MAHTLNEKLPLRRWEQFAATILVSIVALGGAGMLCKLQGHHPNPLWRGGELVSGMVGAMIISAIIVCYLLLRDRAYELLSNMLLLFAAVPML